MLNEQQIRQYDEQGYLMVPNVLEPQTLARLREVTDEVAAGARGLEAHSEFLDLEPSHTPAVPRVRRIKRPHRAHPFYREIAGHRGVMQAISPLIGKRIRLRPGGKVNMKLGECGAPVEWHQDWAFYPHTNSDVLAVGILLDDMDEDNGPLLVLPGSHRGPLYDHHVGGKFCGGIDVGRTDLDLAGTVKVTGPAGSVSIHHALLVHGSGLNRSSRPRRVLFFEYTAADAWPLAGIERIDDFDEFNARMVLGEPTLQPRLEPVPVRMPLPRASHQGSLYENQRALASRYFETATG